MCEDYFFTTISNSTLLQLSHFHATTGAIVVLSLSTPTYSEKPPRAWSCFSQDVPLLINHPLVISVLQFGHFIFSLYTKSQH